MNLTEENPIPSTEKLKKEDVKCGSSTIVIPAELQFLLASLCEFKVPQNERKRLGLRYFKTPEVQKFLLTLEEYETIPVEILQTDANVIISVLKELLSHFPGGIFHDENEEFICVSLKCSLEFALIYVQGLIETLPSFLQNFTYLVCKSLKNLAQQSSGSLIDAYTDLLILFTPVLFPHSVAEISRFLRATRISLILIDMCDITFKPFLAPEILDNTGDEDFFKEIFQRLSQLQNAFATAENFTKLKDPSSEFDICLIEDVPRNLNNNSGYYQITYVE
uniref:Uncharacterized protein n=1 Tax=Acrobeloides nanus TaxID=290746 RepID=A0A914CCE9_9BILA